MFSELIKTLRTDRGYTQKKLAQDVGVSAGNVADWESGRSKPGYNALATLARIFEVSADYLLEIDSSPEKTSLSLDAYKAEQGLQCDGSPLNEVETDLVAMFRLLPERQREELFDLTYFKYKQYVEEKRASIYSTYRGMSADANSGPVQGHEAQDGTA